MTRYRPFPQNKEVMDVLACIITGKSTSKDIVKQLKQPQSTVSTKLRFLTDNKIVIKEKWFFKVNWKKLNKVFYKRMKSAISMFVDEKKKVNNFVELFDDERIKRIIETHSHNTFTFKDEPKSIIEICTDYLVGLSQTNNKGLKKLDKRFIELRDKITFESIQKHLFIEAEEVGVGSEYY